MLVIVKDRNIELFFQPVFDLETSRRGNILKIYAAKNGRYMFDRLDDLVRVLCVQTDRKRIDPAKFLKELTLAFHNRHCGRRTNVAEPEDRRAIRNDGNRVFLDREIKDLFGIFVNGLANTSNPG